MILVCYCFQLYHPFLLGLELVSQLTLVTCTIHVCKIKQPHKMETQILQFYSVTSMTVHVLLHEHERTFLILCDA